MMSAVSLSAASTVLKSTPEKRNFLLLTRLLIAGGTELIRDVFNLIHPPHTLSTVLSSPFALAKLKRSHVTKPQYDLLYPAPGFYGKSTDFDVTLLFKLLREICSLTPPVSTGSWDKLPVVTDFSQEADLARLKFYRNSVYGHTSKMEVSDVDFNRLWKEIREAMLRRAKAISPAKETEWDRAIDKLLIDPLTPEDEDNVMELKTWYLSDMETKEALVRMQSVLEDTNQQVIDVKTAVARSENQTDDIKSIVTRTEDKADDILRDVGVTSHEVTEIKSTVSRTEDKADDILRDVGVTSHEVTEIKSTVSRTEDKADGILRDVGVTSHEVTEIKSTVARTEQKADSILTNSEMTRTALEESSAEVKSTLQQCTGQILSEIKSMKCVHTVDDIQDNPQCVDKRRRSDRAQGASEVSFSVASSGPCSEPSMSESRTVSTARKTVLPVTVEISDCGSDINHHAKFYDPSTRQWLLDDFQAWFNSPCDPESRAYVLLGDAGIGKSVVAAVLAQRMQAQNRLGAAFFCRHNDSTRRNPRYLLSSIAYQICTSNSQYCEIIGGCDGILKLVANHELGVHELFTKLLEEPLSQCKPSAQRQLVIVDALDESQYEGHSDLLDLIVQKFPMLPPWVVFFITSRPEEQIQFRFELFKPCVRICSGDGQQSEHFKKHCADLKTFIRKNLNTIFPGHIRAIEEQGNVLSKKCEGLFLYAHYIMEHVRSLPSLEPFTIANLYSKGIRQFYHENFKRMWSILGESCFKELIGCAVVSPGPLPTSFITVVLSKLGSQLTKQKVLDTISVFFPISNSEDTFSFLHSLVPNWLTDKKESRKYFIDRKAAVNSLRDFIRKGLDDIAHDSTFSSQEEGMRNYILRYGVRFLCEDDTEGVASSLYSCLTNLTFVVAKLGINRSMVYSLIDDYQMCADTMKSRLAANQIQTLELFGKILIDNALLLSKFPHLLLQLIPGESTQVQQIIIHASLSWYHRYTWGEYRPCFSSNRSLMACITEEGHKRLITILNVKTQDVISKALIPFVVTRKPCFSPDDSLVFLGRLDKWFSVDKASFVDLPQFSSNTHQYMSGSFLDDGEFLLVQRDRVKFCDNCSFLLLYILCEFEISKVPSHQTLDFFYNIPKDVFRPDTHELLTNEEQELLEALKCVTTRSNFRNKGLLHKLFYRLKCVNCSFFLCNKFCKVFEERLMAGSSLTFQEVKQFVPHLFLFQLWHIETGKSLVEMQLDPSCRLIDRRLSILTCVTHVMLNRYAQGLSEALMVPLNGELKIENWYFSTCLWNLFGLQKYLMQKSLLEGVITSPFFSWCREREANFHFFESDFVVSYDSAKVFFFTSDRLRIFSLPFLNSRFKVSPNGRWIAVCDGLSRLESADFMWHETGGSSNQSILTISKLCQNEVFKEVDRDVHRYNFSLDNNHLLYTKYDGSLRAYSLQDCTILQCLNSSLIYPACLFSDGKHKTTLYSGDVATVQERPMPTEVVHFDVCLFSKYAILVCSRTRTSVSFLQRKKPKSIDLVTSVLINVGSTGCKCIASNGEQVLVVLDNSITVISRYFKIVSTQETEIIGAVTALSSDGKKVLLCSTDGFVQIVNIWKDGEVVSSLSYRQTCLMNVECGCFLPGDESLVVLCGEYQIQIWDYTSKNCVHSYNIHCKNYKVKCTFCTCSANGDLLACCVGDRVDIFSLCPTGKQTGKEETQLTGHCGCVKWCQFIKGNRYLVTYGVDRYVLLWDLDKKIPIDCTSPATGKEEIVSMAMSPEEEDLLVCAMSSGRLVEIKLQGLDTSQQSGMVVQKYLSPNTVVNRAPLEPQKFPNPAVSPPVTIPESHVQHGKSEDVMTEHNEYNADTDVSSDSDESSGDSEACTEEDDCELS